MDYLKQLVDEWQSQGLLVDAPLPRQQVIELLTETRRPFSSDVVGLYCTTNGLGGQLDNNYFSLRSVPQVLRRSLETSGPDLAFADYLIDSFLFQFHFESPDHSSVYGGFDGRKVAESVGQFFELLRTDPRQLDIFH